MTITAELMMLLLSGIVAVLWYLLKQKDDKQAAEIKLLFQKHDVDAEALQELRVQIAEGHYKKAELDYKFDRIELAITNSFTMLKTSFDKLSDILITHIQQEDKGK